MFLKNAVYLYIIFEETTEKNWAPKLLKVDLMKRLIVNLENMLHY